MEQLKKLWYWLILIGLVIFGITLYSILFRSEELKELLSKRPLKKPNQIKLPKEPTIIDYVDLYRKKIGRL